MASEVQVVWCSGRAARPHNRMNLNNFLNNLPFNWFDILVLVVFIVGLRSGRKHGLSEELIGMLMWLTIALGCAFIYIPVGDLIASGSLFSRLSGYLMAYIGSALLLIAVFAYLKRALGGKLLGSDVFGKSEFYLGMAAGLVRFNCILIVGLALLNARSYNSAEISANVKYQNDVYGSNFFPSLYEVQAQVFEKSIIGPFIKNQLSFLLIESTVPEQKQIKQREYALP
jgi:uncharacterized membrane protein required for colicin V production